MKLDLCNKQGGEFFLFLRFILELNFISYFADHTFRQLSINFGRLVLLYYFSWRNVT